MASRRRWRRRSIVRHAPAGIPEAESRRAAVRIVAPALATGLGVERDDHVGAGAQVEAVAHLQRRGLERAGHPRAVNPRPLQTVDVVAVDLTLWSETGTGLGGPVMCPVPLRIGPCAGAQGRRCRPDIGPLPGQQQHRHRGDDPRRHRPGGAGSNHRRRRALREPPAGARQQEPQAHHGEQRDPGHQPPAVQPHLPHRPGHRGQHEPAVDRPAQRAAAKGQVAAGGQRRAGRHVVRRAAARQQQRTAHQQREGHDQEDDAERSRLRMRSCSIGHHSPSDSLLPSWRSFPQGMIHLERTGPPRGERHIEVGSFPRFRAGGGSL